MKKIFKQIEENRLHYLRVFIFLLAMLVVGVNMKKCQRGLTECRKKGPDLAISFDADFSPVRAILPENAEVGFFNDETDFGEMARALYLAQYSLSPHIIFKDQLRDFTIARFHQPDGKRIFTTEHNLRFVKTIDAQTALYERVPPK